MEIVTKLWLIISMLVGVAEMNDFFSNVDEDNTFFYFAYGSNMLKSRMHINCKSAKFLSKAKLEGWRLDFNTFVPAWGGAVATIVEDPDRFVWGAVWQISNEEMAKLDNQEGVHLGWYVPKYVMLNSSLGGVSSGIINARTYIQNKQPEYVPPENLPENRRPSRTYAQVIMFGAIESMLPVSYLDYLRKFPYSDNTASPERLKSLGYPFWEDTQGLNETSEFNPDASKYRSDIDRKKKGLRTRISREVYAPRLSFLVV